jgi:hypothetical protein
MENKHAPIVHGAPGADPTAAHVPGPRADVSKPLVHAAPESAAAPVIHHGQPVSEVYDLLQTEAKKRKAAEEHQAEDPKPAA